MSKDDQQKRDSHTGRAGLWPPEKRSLVAPQATANLVSHGQLGVVCAALLLGGCATPRTVALAPAPSQEFVPGRSG